MAVVNQYLPNTTCPTYYPTYTYTVQNEDARLRLALELVAEADSLDEAKRIARKALYLSEED